MWVTGPCSPSSVRKQSRSLLCSPTASARYEENTVYRARRPCYSSVHNPGCLPACISNPYLSELSTAASVFCLLERCIEVVGARRAWEKNRRPTAHYAVQSCAMETVGRTILQGTVAAEMEDDVSRGNDCAPIRGFSSQTASAAASPSF